MCNNQITDCTALLHEGFINTAEMYNGYEFCHHHPCRRSGQTHAFKLPGRFHCSVASASGWARCRHDGRCKTARSSSPPKMLHRSRTSSFSMGRSAAANLKQLFSILPKEPCRRCRHPRSARHHDGIAIVTFADTPLLRAKLSAGWVKAYRRNRCRCRRPRHDS